MPVTLFIPFKIHVMESNKLGAVNSKVPYISFFPFKIHYLNVIVIITN